jgi:hypothetical protein
MGRTEARFSLLLAVGRSHPSRCSAPIFPGHAGRRSAACLAKMNSGVDGLGRASLFKPQIALDDGNKANNLAYRDLKIRQVPIKIHGLY